jgi:hypothetical protein
MCPKRSLLPFATLLVAAAVVACGEGVPPDRGELTGPPRRPAGS